MHVKCLFIQTFGKPFTFKTDMMRRILLTSFLVANALIISAIPAKRGIWRTITTKDGTQMKVELRGNEYKHYWQSEDGQCFTKDTDGQFVRTELEAILHTLNKEVGNYPFLLSCQQADKLCGMADALEAIIPPGQRQQVA